MEGERRNPLTKIIFSSRLVVVLVLVLVLVCVCPTTGASFIASSCKGTTYPKVCYDSLSQYEAAVGSNHWKLCNRAMWVALQAARNSSVLVYGLSKKHPHTKAESDVMDVCVENVLDGTDMIRQSMNAMGVGRLTKTNFDWQISNIKTWMSTAISDCVTCADAFDELSTGVNPSLKKKVVGSVNVVDKYTSNALYFINNLPPF